MIISQRKRLVKAATSITAYRYRGKAREVFALGKYHNIITTVHSVALISRIILLSTRLSFGATKMRVAARRPG